MVCHRLKLLAALLLFVVIGPATVAAAPEDSPWGRDYFPNVELLDQEGNKLRFYDDLIKDRVVAINFIYTHCGDSCPLETASLKRVQKLLADRVGKDIFFYSISIDPEHDSPKVLKDYAENFHTGPGWLFLTGKNEDVTLIRKKLGLYKVDVETGKLNDHNISFMLGNERTGRWIKRSPFDEPKVLAWLLGNSLSRDKTKRHSQRVSYSEAKPLTKRGHGEDLFRFRCLPCHSLGQDDGLGPGLLGVTKLRERSWLFRWLKAPDKFLSEKDPIALDLFNRYNKIIMPNLKLSDYDVDELIAYLKSNDQAAEPTNRH